MVLENFGQNEKYQNPDQLNEGSVVGVSNALRDKGFLNAM